jgi:hypothetical protein
MCGNEVHTLPKLQCPLVRWFVVQPVSWPFCGPQRWSSAIKPYFRELIIARISDISKTARLRVLYASVRESEESNSGSLWLQLQQLHACQGGKLELAHDTGGHDSGGGCIDEDLVVSELSLRIPSWTYSVAVLSAAEKSQGP